MFAAFHIPDLPVAASLMAFPTYVDHPCAVAKDSKEQEDEKASLLAINAPAWQTGIKPGWQVNRALVRCPDLKVLPRKVENEKKLLAELTSFAERFSADIEITSADTVILDLSGTKRAHFHGLEMLPDSEMELVHALAETPDLAHFAVMESRIRGRYVLAHEIGKLPIALLSNLEADSGFLSMLELFGIHTLADYLALPRQELTTRFGVSAGKWQDQISGKTCRLLRLHRPPESLLQIMEPDDPIHSSEALLFLFKRMLHVVAARVSARHLAVCKLDIRLILEKGALCREIYLPEPSCDPLALLKPIQTYAESLVLPSPVVRLELDATSSDPHSQQHDWMHRRLPNPERWADTLTRLEALVGADHVGIPEHANHHEADGFHLRVPKETTQTNKIDFFPATSVPLRRLRPPVNVTVLFSEETKERFPRPLAILNGPWSGQVLGALGPFLTSGQTWSPDSTWDRVEWDLQIEHAPVIRVSCLAKVWQLEGIYQ